MKNENTNETLLAATMGEQSAKELVKLTSNYDKYLAKFKSKVNELLAPIDHEIVVGIAFVKKAQKEKKE